VGCKELDTKSTFYVVNPEGDLKKTEELFRGWFTREEGWEGVVGELPPSEVLSTALQEKDLFV
jgi:separase